MKWRTYVKIQVGYRSYSQRELLFNPRADVRAEWLKKELRNDVGMLASVQIAAGHWGQR